MKDTILEIEKIKKKILDLAIRGKLVLQDPNDEPASVLVEKIRKEKEKLIKEGKIKPSKNDSIIYKGSDNCYYEKINNSIINSSINYKFSDNIIWVKGKDIMLPMESTKPQGETFSYIDIDAIDNKSNIIKSSKIINSKNAPSRATRKIYSTSTLFSMVRPYLRNIAFVGEENKDAIASTGFYVCTPFSFILPKYLFMLLQSDYVVNGLNYFMKGDNSPSINGTNIENFYFPIPSISYQKNAINIFYNVNSIVSKLSINIQDILFEKERLRFKILNSIFSDNSSYKSYYENKFMLGDILPYEQPAPYIVENAEYSDAYKTPVLTPGKTFILGYTNEKKGIYKIDGKKKVIIFDDFTTASRLVDFDFKVKSSAMKILSSVDNNKFDIEYMYYLLQTIKINANTHKRFWISEYAPIKLKIHTYDEQLKIVKLINQSFELFNKM